MTDYSGKRPLHLGCGEGLCSYLGTRMENLGDMRADPERRPPTAKAEPGGTPRNGASADKKGKERA